MARVAVVFPPLRVARDFIDYPYFADLGAVQAAALLRAQGHDVQLVDALARPGAELAPLDGDYVRLGTTIDDVVGATENADVFVLAFTPFHRPPEREPLLAELLEKLRAHGDASIVLADLYQTGQHVVDVPSTALLATYPEVDAVVRYEAEGVLPALVAELAATGRPSRPRVEIGHEFPKLDELPLPAWDLTDPAAYWRFHESVMVGLGRPEWAFPIDRRSMPMLSTRGCPFRCAHCSSNAGLPAGTPKNQRRHSVEYLGRYLDMLKALGAERVHLLDELANVNERHFDRLLEMLEERQLAFEIPNGVRADYVLEKHLRAMKGRLTTLSVSAESGVQRVVDEVVGKDLDLAAILTVAERAQTADVPLLVHFMIGLPGETKNEINGTLDFAMKLHDEFDAWPSVQFATPLPGTRLAKMASESARVLPTVQDWGPHFQKAPTIATQDFTLEDLEVFKSTFDMRFAASGGPKKVIMNVTYKCNNRCTFCAVGTRTQFDGDFDQQKELLVKYRKRGVELLDYDGGEPTLNPRLFQLIKFARRIGYEKVNVTTNGRMAQYEEYAQKLVTSGITTLLFSIHGPNRWIHAANVGVPEAFDQTLDGVRNCRRLAPDSVELGANITLTKSNYKHIGETVELIHSLGLGWLNVQFLTPFGRATNTVNPDTQAAADATMRAIDEWKDRVRFCVINLPWCYMPGYEEFLMGDLLKLERHMLFVNNEEVNLFEYLREQREYTEPCGGCTRRVFCGGFYRMDDVPEPEWLIEPEDLVRPIETDGLTAHPRPERPRGAQLKVVADAE